MTAIGGSGGVSGPMGATGATGPSATDAADDLDGATGGARIDRPETTGRAGRLDAAAHVTDTGEIDALASDVAAGRLTRDEAIDRLIEATASNGLDVSERAELRELLGDLVANDPYLGGLIGRM